MKMKTLRLMLPLAAIFLAASTQGSILFSQTPVVTYGNPNIPNHLDLAAGFTLGSPGTVRSVTWQGAYGSGDPPPATDTFSIIFFGNSGGNVGAVLGTFPVGNPLSRIDTGLDATSSGDGDVYQYVSDLGAGMVLAAGTYWIEIKAASSTPRAYWGAGANNSLFAYDTGSGFTSSNDRTMYFVLDDTNVIPAPAAVWLFGSALGVMGWLRRKVTA